MNLIEQLGGYEKASEDFKKLHLNLKEQQKSNKVFMDASDALKTELLEYRRQHNIFEVGDRIVIDGKYDETFMPVLTILDEGKNYYYCDDGQVHKHLMNQWRHATPEEIKAGKRL